MSIDGAEGYRHVLKGPETRRWQYRLFAQIRTAPLYRDVLTELQEAWEQCAHLHGHPVFEDPHGRPSVYRMLEQYSAGQTPEPSTSYFDALKTAAKTLNLTFEQAPASWALIYFQQDRAGVFELEGSAPIIAPGQQARSIDLEMGWSSWQVNDLTVEHDPPGMVGAEQWAALEDAAVEAARQAVVKMREQFAEPHTSDYFQPDRIKAGSEDARSIQIARLAFRLTGQGGMRNPAHTDRRWCARLSLDVPSTR